MATTQLIDKTLLVHAHPQTCTKCPECMENLSIVREFCTHVLVLAMCFSLGRGGRYAVFAEPCTAGFGGECKGAQGGK